MSVPDIDCGRNWAGNTSFKHPIRHQYCLISHSHITPQKNLCVPVSLLSAMGLVGLEQAHGALHRQK